MKRICTLCNFTTDSDFHWTLHLTSEFHRTNKLKAQNAELLSALKAFVSSNDNGSLSLLAHTALIDNARAVILKIEVG